jgi:hypothetical protein
VHILFRFNLHVQPAARSIHACTIAAGAGRLADSRTGTKQESSSDQSIHVILSRTD